MAAPSAGKSPIVQTILALVVATVFGVGGGSLLGMALVMESGAPEGEKAEHGLQGKHEKASAKHGGDKTEKGHGHGGHGSAAKSANDAAGPKMRLKELPPIVTNLAAPETAWVRLQASIVYDAEAAPHPDILISEVTADIVAFLRTTTLVSIEGSDGLRRLQEDLTDRAITRSEGHIREFIIQALVVQ